jgi:hypothetical protein
MSKEAMKLALEALENSVDLVREDAYQAEKLYGNYPTRQGKVNGLKVLADDHEKAITALREALAEQALDKMAENARELGQGYEPARLPFGVGGGLVAIKTLLSRDPRVHANTAIQMIDAILAEQPAQQRTDELLEIFKDVDQCGPLLGMGGKKIGCVNHDCDQCKEQPAVQQEPVAWMSDRDVGFKKSEFGATPTVPLYTSPPTLSLAQRKPLTDEEIEPIAIDVLGYGALCREDMNLFTQAVRAIESAHGIKENT